MKLTISYAELQEYVASHFHKTVNVGHVDGKTVSVSLPIKVFGFTKSVSINVGVEKIEGTDLYLSYDGKMVSTCLCRLPSPMPSGSCRRRLDGWNKGLATS